MNPAVPPTSSKSALHKVGIAMVRDEADIIEPFVRHHLSVVDQLVVTDNGSLDGTWEILELLAAEANGRLVLHRDGRLGRYQAEIINALLKNAAHSCAADWIFPLDADEFLSLPESASPLEDPAHVQDVYQIAWKTYTPDPSDNIALLNPVERMRHRVVCETNLAWNHKVIIPGILARRPEARVGRGNHHFYLGQQEAPWLLLEQGRLGHFSLRSAWQAAGKTCLRQLQHQCDPDYLSKRQDYEWPSYRAIKEDFTLFEEKFRQALPAHLHHDWPWKKHATVDDPFPYRGGPLRYTKAPPDRDRFILGLLNYGEAMAEIVRHAAPRPPAPSIPASWTVAYHDRQGQRRTDLLTAELIPDVPAILTWRCEDVDWRRPIQLIIKPGQTLFEIRELRGTVREGRPVPKLPFPSGFFRLVSGGLELTDRTFFIAYTSSAGGRLECGTDTAATFDLSELKALSWILVASQDPARVAGVLAGPNHFRWMWRRQTERRRWWKPPDEEEPNLRKRMLLDPPVLHCVRAVLETTAVLPRLLCPALPGELLSCGPGLDVPDGSYRVTLHYRPQPGSTEQFDFWVQSRKERRPIYRGSAALRDRSHTFTLALRGMFDLEICLLGTRVPYEVEFIELQRLETSTFGSRLRRAGHALVDVVRPRVGEEDR